MIGCDDNDSGDSGLPLFTGPVPDDSYSIELKLVGDYWLVLVNGQPFAATINADRFNADTFQYQIERQLTGLDYIPVDYKALTSAKEA